MIISETVKSGVVVRTEGNDAWVKITCASDGCDGCRISSLCSQPSYTPTLHTSIAHGLKIKAGDKVNGGLVVFANNSSVEVKSTGGGSWYYKNGSDVNRYDHSGLFWGASVSSDNYLSGIWAMMPIGVVTDDNFNLGVLYGTDSRESGGCYVLRERTVTRYQTVYDNGQYRGVPEAEFRIPRIWPAFTSASLASLRDFSKFSVGDIVGGCIVIAVYSKILRTLSSSGVEIFEYNLTSKKARIFNWGYEISESSFSDLPDILSPGPVSPLGDDNN